jgi:putative membrane protein
MVQENPVAGKSGMVKKDTSTNLAIDRTDLATERTDFAFNRTSMAASRTLMAWIRTGISLVAFGFTIYQFLQYLADNSKGNVALSQGPRTLGITMVSLGTLCMIFGLIDYCGLFIGLGKPFRRKMWSSIFFMGVILVLLGLFLLATIILNIEAF